MGAPLPTPTLRTTRAELEQASLQMRRIRDARKLRVRLLGLILPLVILIPSVLWVTTEGWHAFRRAREAERERRFLAAHPLATPPPETQGMSPEARNTVVPTLGPVLTPDEQAAVQQGDALRRQGSLNEAVAAYRTALVSLDKRGANTPSLNSLRVALHNRIGVLLGSTHQYSDAAREFHDALAITPSSPALVNNYAVALIGVAHENAGAPSGNAAVKEAITRLKDGIRRFPDFAPLHRSLGIALQLTGDSADAQREAKIYEKAQAAQNGGSLTGGGAPLNLGGALGGVR